MFQNSDDNRGLASLMKILEKEWQKVRPTKREDYNLMKKQEKE